MDFKEQYKKMNERIKPDPALLENLLEEAGEWGKRRKDRGRALLKRLLRYTAVAAAACLCILVTVPVMASNPAICRLMYRLSPQLAQRFVPIQLQDEDQGIRMEVAAVNVHGNEAQIYITLQDLEGDRIDETTDLFDSYHIWADSGFSIESCSAIGYDEDTGVIEYLITIIQDEEIDAGKITFCVSELIGQKHYYENIEIPIPLTEAEQEPESMNAALRGVSGAWETAAKFDGYTAKVLKPGQPDERFPVEGMELTGLGYVDGALHIQYAAPDNLENDNHGYFTLEDVYGNRKMADYTLSFWGNTEETKTVAYDDAAFLISPSSLSDYTLRGDFWVSGLRMEGNWSVTFSLE